MKSKLALAILAAALAAVAVLSAAGHPEPVPGHRVVLHGILVDLTEGVDVDLAAATHGRTTLVFLWDTWCPACTSKIPDMNRAYRALQGRDDVRFLSVCGDNGYEGADPNETSQARAAAHVKKQKIRYPALFDTGAARVSTQFGDADFPNLFLLDPNGTVVATWNSEGGYEKFMKRAGEYLGVKLRK